MTDVQFRVQPGRCLVRAAILLLGRDQEDDGVEIREGIAIGAGEDHVFKQADGQPGQDIDAEMVGNAIFLWVDIIRIVDEVLVDQLHIHHLVIQLPNAGIDLDKGIGRRIITEKEAAIAVADEILIIADLNVEIFQGVEIDRSPVIEIVIPVFFENSASIRRRARP